MLNFKVRKTADLEFWFVLGRHSELAIATNNSEAYNILQPFALYWVALYYVVGQHLAVCFISAALEYIHDSLAGEIDLRLQSDSR